MQFFTYNRILRIENSEGYGPYNANHNGEPLDRAKWAVSDHDNSRTHPTAYEDTFVKLTTKTVTPVAVIERLFKGLPYRFGFISVAKLRRWFCPEELAALKELGFCPVEYSVPKENIYYSFHQALFLTTNSEVTRAGWEYAIY